MYDIDVYYNNDYCSLFLNDINRFYFRIKNYNFDVEEDNIEIIIVYSE